MCGPRKEGRGVVVAERCCVCGTTRRVKYRTATDKPICVGCGSASWSYDLGTIDLPELFRVLRGRARKAERRRQKARRDA
jgi:hypothetical protein